MLAALGHGHVGGDAGLLWAARTLGRVSAGVAARVGGTARARWLRWWLDMTVRRRLGHERGSSKSGKVGMVVRARSNHARLYGGPLTDEKRKRNRVLKPHDFN